MDISKLKKPFHIVCPHCKKEVEIYANDIEKRYQNTKRELAEIAEQIRLFKSEYREDYKTNKWFKSAQRAYAHKQQELCELKKTRGMLIEEGERQLFRAFKDIVKLNLGEEKTVKWLKEAEENIQYNTYDTAIQKYSTIMSQPNSNK